MNEDSYKASIIISRSDLSKRVDERRPRGVRCILRLADTRVAIKHRHAIISEKLSVCDRLHILTKRRCQFQLIVNPGVDDISECIQN